MAFAKSTAESNGTTRELAQYSFARDNAVAKFLDWREESAEIAALPRLDMGGVLNLSIVSAAHANDATWRHVA